jgi:PAS domain S-box-containing protein
LVIYFKLFNSPLIKEFNIGIWIAVASNLIFLSWVSVVLISNTIGSLENTIIKEFRLKNELKKQKVTGIRHNEQLKESEGHYKSLFFLNPWPMWVLDSKTKRFLQVNEAAVQNYGYTNEEFLTMSLKDIELQNDVEVLHNEQIAKMLLSTITQHSRKNKEQFYVEIIFNSIPFDGLDATLLIARDITEQMNYIKAIEGKNEKLHEIAYIQSHYVRAPLARIMGLVGLLTRDLNEKPNPEFLSYLDQSAKELDDIIRTITSKTEQFNDL